MAVKVLKSFNKEKEEVWKANPFHLTEQEFKQEVEIMSTVSHPNIMGLLGACTELADPISGHKVWAMITQVNIGILLPLTLP